jgi:hypothetical protein
VSVVHQAQKTAPSVLGRASSTDVARAPFAYVALDDALPADDYVALAGSFPPLEAFLGELADTPENYAVRLEFRQAEAAGVASNAWRDFFAYHVSQDFWRDVVRVFGSELRAAHPDLESRIGKPFEEWRVKQRGAPEEAEIALACQFVVNTPTSVTTSVKPAHIDRADKIFAGLFYMRRPDDRSEGAGLQLFRHRGKPVFDKHETPWSSVEQAKCVEFAANRFIGFVNSEQSVHAVEPRTPSPVPRRYINIIAELPDTRAFKPPQMGKVRRMIYRNFQRPPRRTIGMED